MRKLLPETERLWDFLQAQPGLAGFTLIGGSALTLRIGHRISEDIDLVWAGPKLPRTALDITMRLIKEAGFTSVERDDDNDAYDEFLNAGMSLHDYQQNFLVDGVKLQFFAPDQDLVRLLTPPAGQKNPGPRLAELSEIFDLKCLAAANRSVSRDALDLFVMLRDHGFTLSNFAEAFRKAGLKKGAEQALSNLARGTFSPADPGYEALMDHPPGRDDLRTFFQAYRNSFEIEMAAQAISEDLSEENRG